MRSRGLACAIRLMQADVAALIEVAPLALSVEVRSKFLRSGCLARAAERVAIELRSAMTLHAQHAIVFPKIGFDPLRSHVVGAKLRWLLRLRRLLRCGPARC